MFWLGAAVSLCYVPGYTGAYIATQWPVLAVLLAFGLLRSGPFTIFHGLWLLFFAYAAARILPSPAPEAGVFGLWLVAILGLSLWFGSTLESTRGLYGGLALGAGISSAVAVMQHFGLNWPESVTPHAGLYVNSVQQGAVLAMIAVALVSERMWLWVVPLVPGIVLAGSRGAWLMLAVGLLGCCVRRIWIFGLVGVVGAFYLLNALSKSDFERLQIWGAAWHNLKLFGWGPGVFYTMMIQLDGKSFFPDTAHNDALQLLFEHGVGAVFPLAIFAFALFRAGDKEWPVVVTFVAGGCWSTLLAMPIAAFLALVAVGRILRAHGLAGGDCGHSGRHVLPWRRGRAKASGGDIPVASHHST